MNSDINDINNSYIDMHIHTSFSDGIFTPKEVVEYALKMNLSAISITDHDSIDAIDEAFSFALYKDIEIIPGIELSCDVEPESGKSEMHILGYFIDYKSEHLKKTLNVFKQARYDRAIKIFDKLQESGVELKNVDFISNIGKVAIGRLHFAKALIEERFVGSVQEAFQRYLSKDKPAYVPKSSISAKDAIKLILDSGGIPVMAHPYYVHYSDIDLFKSLVDCGLMGIEAWHIKHSESAVKKFIDMSKEFNLIATGGSDCHGPFKKEKPVMGKIKVPYSVLVNLKNARESLYKN
ncbi:MAG: PHP domain-containing protein [Endomicrobium sp.]|jgi:predicted metal-dependent phosphoesterase TrpH|nr:PHP domain-containing protein [Endomicrobium sp.]